MSQVTAAEIVNYRQASLLVAVLHHAHLRNMPKLIEATRPQLEQFKYAPDDLRSILKLTAVKASCHTLINTADEAKLNQWLDKILSANSIEEVFH